MYTFIQQYSITFLHLQLFVGAAGIESGFSSTGVLAIGPEPPCIFTMYTALYSVLYTKYIYCRLGWSVEIFFDRTEQGN